MKTLLRLTDDGPEAVDHANFTGADDNKRFRYHQ
jgi:hypothetical protein